MSASEIAFHRHRFVRCATRAFPVEESINEEEAGEMFDAALALPMDQFMGHLLDLIRNAEHAPESRQPPALSLITALAEARHLAERAV